MISAKLPNCINFDHRLGMNPHGFCNGFRQLVCCSFPVSERNLCDNGCQNDSPLWCRIYSFATLRPELDWILIFWRSWDSKPANFLAPFWLPFFPFGSLLAPFWRPLGSLLLNLGVHCFWMISTSWVADRQPGIFSRCDFSPMNDILCDTSSFFLVDFGFLLLRF